MAGHQLFLQHLDRPTNALTSDEPWSRPGDYVLLRALTDLVCASSSCTDDIDPANGWNPTDIHIRVYDGGETFSKGSALRMTPDAEPRLTRETAFHPRLEALTRNFVDYRGFWLPTSFTGRGAVEEYWACREGVAVMDLSPLRKFEVMGPDAEQLLQRTVTRDILKLSTGQVVYTALCYDHGGMIDDATVLRLGPNNFRVVAGDDFTGIWLRRKAEEWGLKVFVKSSTDHLANLAVQGPKSRELLAQVIWTPPHQPSIAELKWFRFTIARLGRPGGPSVIVSRTGYTGELGFEVWCHPKDAVAVWDAVAEAGRPLGLTPLGLDALDMLRIEAGLVFAHYDFDDGTDPVRGRDRLCGGGVQGQRFRRPRGAAPAQGQPVAQARGPRPRRERDDRPRRPGLRRPRPGRHRHQRHALADPEEDDRAGQDRRCACGRAARRSRSASSTATRSGSAPPSHLSRISIRKRRVCGRKRVRGTALPPPPRFAWSPSPVNGGGLSTKPLRFLPRSRGRGPRDTRWRGSPCL